MLNKSTCTSSAYSSIQLFTIRERVQEIDGVRVQYTIDSFRQFTLQQFTNHLDKN